MVHQTRTYAAGLWLRRLAYGTGVNPWLLLDQLTAPGVPARLASARGDRGAPDNRGQYRTGRAG
jgi:hypothetical protein